MELQSFIDKNPNYIDIIRDNGFKIKHYSKYKLWLIKNHYGKELIEIGNDLWKMYCKSVVIDTETNKIVSLSPIKSVKLETIDYLLKNESQDETTEVQQIVDGTMIQLFYHKGEWLLQSRSEIGGNNRNYKCPSFKNLFEECSNIEYELLDKNHIYSFVMRHIKNRIVTPVCQNIVVLVDVFERKDGTIHRLTNQEVISKYKEMNGFDVIETIQISELQNITLLNWYCKGYTFKNANDNHRFSWINPEYKYVESLIQNQQNPLYHYIELRKNGQINDYLKYFPEKINSFTLYRDKIHKMTNDLYSHYKNIKIHKKGDMQSCPYKLRPLLSKLHKKYLETKVPISWTDMKQFIHVLDTKQLVFVLNQS